MRRSHWVTNLMVKMLPLVLIRVPMILALDAEPIRRPWALVTQVSETQEDIVIRVLDRSGDKKGSLITNINDFKRAPHFYGRVWWMADPRFNQLHSRNKIRVPIGFGTWGRTWQSSNKHCSIISLQHQYTVAPMHCSINSLQHQFTSAPIHCSYSINLI